MNKKMAIILSAVMVTNTCLGYSQPLLAEGLSQETGIDQAEENPSNSEEVIIPAEQFPKEEDDVLVEDSIIGEIQCTTPAALHIATLPSKTVYNQGEELDLTDGTIEVVYEDETTQTLTMLDQEVVVAGYNSQQIGNQTVEVTYESLNTHFDVEVKPLPKTNIIGTNLSKDKWTECEDGKWRRVVEQPGLAFEQMEAFSLDTTIKDNVFFAEKEGVVAQLQEGYIHNEFEAERAKGLYYTSVQGTDLLYRLTGLDTNKEYEIRYRINRETDLGWGTLWINQLEGSAFSPEKKVSINKGENIGVIQLNAADDLKKVDSFLIKLGTGQPGQKIFIDYIEIVEVVNENPDKVEDNQLSKDHWVKCEDGKWRKIVDQPEFDFESLATGVYEAEYKPGVPTLNKFYDSGSGASVQGAFEIVELELGNKGLKFTPSVAAPNNLMYKTKVNKNYTYELNFNYSFKNESGTGINTTLAAQNNGAHITGQALNQDGTLNNETNPNYNASSRQGIHLGKLIFEAPSSGTLDLKLWKGGDAEVVIDTLELIAISPINPEEVTEKEALIRANDLVMPQNAGEFENWKTSTIPGEKNTETSFYTSGEVSINESDAANVNGLSAKITNGSELVLEVDELKQQTEYSIFFKAKPNTGGRVEFRLSGFKDNQAFDYDNGDYNGGDWKNDSLGRGNMFNWIENLKIADSKWNVFRYDFTTGDNLENSMRARFKAVGADAYVDSIYLVERNTLNELNYTLPENDEISKGNRILIDQGLQFQSWITTDLWEQEKGWIKQPGLDEIKELGLTAVQYNDKPNFSKALHEQADAEGISLKWATAWGPKYSHISTVYQDSSDGRTGSPTEEEWKEGHLTPEMGSEYVDDLVSMCIGDEEDYSDTLTQNIKSWFEAIRANYPNVLLHHNEVGNSPQDNLRQISTFNKDMLRKYVRTAKPDMITYDMYYFRERRIDQTQGGSVIPFYNDLNRYRIVSREGLDGTGEQPIPFGQYHYAWRTGPGAATSLKRGDGWYEMTESQINLYAFATWTFGGKWMSNFRWLDDNPSYLFSDYKVGADGKHGTYHIFDQFKEMIRQSKNLGPHLVRLQNEDVAIVRGEHLNDNGTVELNRKPDDNKDWSDIRDDKLNSNVFIKDIEVTNLGEQNDGLNGDVFISYFNMLNHLPEEDKDVFTSTDPRYFMILNGLTSGDGLPAEMQQGSSYETRQEIKVTFELPNDVSPSQLKKVSRVDGGDTLSEQGKIVDVPLTHVSDNIYELTMVIGGGYADLFYWELGEENVDTVTRYANEIGKEDLSVGQEKYVNEIEKRELEGRTIVIGHIAGTNDLAPEARMAQNINTPAVADLIDGKKINLETYATPGGNIGAIGMRYFSQDLWEFRINRIQEDNNVTLEFKEYDWTKGELLENVEKMKSGEQVLGMPDILVIPDTWIWEKGNLVEAEAVLAMGDFEEIVDFDERKWNDAYTEMTTRDGKTYASTIDASMNPTGIFVNKTLLKEVGATSLGANGIYELQKQDKWTFKEFNQIIDQAIQENIVSKGIKLFADNEDLLRQLLISSGVDTNPYKFDATSEAYQRAITLYTKLKDNDLLMTGTRDEHMEAFSNDQLIFLVAPYAEVAQHFAKSYWYYEDNTIRKYEKDFKGWGEQIVTAPEDGEPWSVTVRNRPDGKYAMETNEWNFMLFPKVTTEDDYRAILNNVSYPVILSTTENPEDVAFILNQVQEEYKGIETTAEFLKRGGVEYPDGRTWEPRYGDNARDLDTLRKVGLRDGYGDNLKASGVWDDVLYDLIQTNPNEYEMINEAVSEYFDENDEDDNEQVDKTRLNKLIQEAKTKEEAVYTKQSFKALTAAIKQAEKVSSGEQFKQSKVDKEVERLAEALRNLVSIQSSEKVNKIV